MACGRDAGDSLHIIDFNLFHWNSRFDPDHISSENIFFIYELNHRHLADGLESELGHKVAWVQKIIIS